MPQYQMPRPLPPIGGASVTPVPLVHTTGQQPDQARYAGLQAQRFLVAAPKYVDGAPSLQSYIFAVGQPQSRRQIQIPRAKAPIDVVTAAVTQTDVFRSEQPDAARYAARQAPRFLVPAPPRLDGATVQASFIFPPNQPDQSRYSAKQQSRFVVDAPKRIDDGAAVIAPQTYVFPLAQPELRAWLKFDANRVPAGPTPQLNGPTTQATFVFPVSQPEPRYYLRNTFAETKTPILGVTVVAAQTYEFTVSQPEARRYNLPDVNRYAQTGPEAPLDNAVVPQTYVFAVGQPELRAWLRFDPNRVPAGPAPQLAGATSQQTYVFVPNQPDQRSYALLQRARGLGGTVAWPLDTFMPAFVDPTLVRFTGEACATPTFFGSLFGVPAFINEQVIE